MFPHIPNGVQHILTTEVMREGWSSLQFVEIGLQVAFLESFPRFEGSRNCMQQLHDQGFRASQSSLCLKLAMLLCGVSSRPDTILQLVWVR